MNHSSKIYIAGHTGLVGSAIYSRLKNEGYENIIVALHKDLDLTRQSEVENFFAQERPEYIFLCAAKVGGIYANSTYPAQFIYENLSIQTNVIHSAYKYSSKKLLFFGSACSYPRECPQPMKEKYLLSGYLEPTNEPYAVAKIAGIKMCQAYNKQYGAKFICAIPTNIYGPNDNFSSENSHVIPALIKKFHEAKVNGMQSETIWGTGKPKREFIYVDDIANASVFLMKNYDGAEIVNIGSGEEISIQKLAFCIKEIAGFKGDIEFDTSKLDGSPRKILDSSRLEKLGWKANTQLRYGLEKTYEWYINNEVMVVSEKG